MTATITPLSILDGAIQELRGAGLGSVENALWRLDMLRKEVEAMQNGHAQLVQTVEQLGNMLAAGSGNPADTAKLQRLRATLAPRLSVGLLPNWNGNPRMCVAFKTSDEAWAFHAALSEALANG